MKNSRPVGTKVIDLFFVLAMVAAGAWWVVHFGVIISELFGGF